MRKADAFENSMPNGVLLGHFERVLRIIQSPNPGDWAVNRNRNGQAPAASAEVQNRKFSFLAGQELVHEIPGTLGQQFGLRPGYQHVRIHCQVQPAKTCCACHILEGFVLPTPPDQFAAPFNFFRGKRLVEMQIQLHAPKIQRVREQQLGLQTR